MTAFASASGRETARNPPKLEDMPSGVGLNGDAEVERAVAVARLLHVNDLRRLQSEVDAFLVAPCKSTPPIPRRILASEKSDDSRRVAFTF